MAIKIPSSNIYEINNPKVRDNVITKVGIEQKVITPKNEYDVSVYNGTVFTEGESYSIGVKETDSEFVGGNINPGSYTETVEYVKATPYTINGTVVVPKVANNVFISHLKSGVDDDGNSNIKARVVYRTDTAPTTASATVRTLATNTYLVSVSNISIGAYTIGTSSKENADEFLSISTTNTKVEFDTPIQISNVTENEEDYTFDYSLVIGSDQIKLTYGATYVQGTTIPDVKPLNGTAYKNVPLLVEITCYGDTVSIDLTDNTVEYGNGNKPYTLSGSELMQDSSTNAIANIPTSDGLATNVLSEYKYGKETAVLKCNIGDYYDTNDNLCISSKTVVPTYTFRASHEEMSGNPLRNHYVEFTIDNVYKNDITINFTATLDGMDRALSVVIPSGDTKARYNGVFTSTSTLIMSIVVNSITSGQPPMTFQIGDIVMPYVFGANKQDKPMSKYKDGSPKMFRVIGVRLYFSGATWQDITIQELTNSLDK